jgi:hypothetical protein
MRKKDKLPKLQTAEEALRRAEAALQDRPLEFRMWGGSKGQDQRVWNHLIYYLNADLPADTAAYLRLLQILNELTCMDPTLVFMLKECGRGDDDGIRLWELSEHQASNFVSLAGRYQPDLKNLILWLCKPKSHPELRERGLRFLDKGAHGESWKVDYDVDPITDDESPFDEDKEPPEVYFVKQTKYASIVVPICKFIFGYVDGLAKGLPIRVCKRLGCGKFFMPQRTGRKIYCSDDCRVLDHQNDKSKDEKADDAYVRRLKQLTAGRLRRKLNLPKVENRLKEIESRRPQMKETIGDLRAS